MSDCGCGFHGRRDQPRDLLPAAPAAKTGLRSADLTAESRTILAAGTTVGAGYGRFDVRECSCSPASHPARAATVSPSTFVSDQAPPTLLVLSRDDHLVPIAGALRFSEAARGAGAAVTTVRIPHTDYGSIFILNGVANQTHGRHGSTPAALSKHPRTHQPPRTARTPYVLGAAVSWLPQNVEDRAAAAIAALEGLYRSEEDRCSHGGSLTAVGLRKECSRVDTATGVPLRRRHALVAPL